MGVSGGGVGGGLTCLLVPQSWLLAGVTSLGGSRLIPHVAGSHPLEVTYGGQRHSGALSPALPGGQDAPQSVVFVTAGPGTSPTWAWGEDLIGRQTGGQVQSLT